MSILFAFPGQGSQHIGMGRAFSEALGDQSAFREVDEALGEPLSRLVFSGQEEALNLTENAQPALMAAGIDALRYLELRCDSQALWSQVGFVAGHSLGEYSALTAARALDVCRAAQVLRIRGRAMQSAVPAGEGAMAAVMGLDEAALLSLLASVEGICDLANDNGGGQWVLSGEREAVESAVALAREAGARRAVMLKVSAPFHSRLMKPAEAKMAAALEQTPVATPRVPVISNVTAKPTVAGEEIRANLVAQVCGRVRWRETIESLMGLNVRGLIEFGAGRVLCGLARRIHPELATFSLRTPADITDELCAFLGSRPAAS